MTVLMKEQDDVMVEAGRGPQDPRYSTIGGCDPTITSDKQR